MIDFHLPLCTRMLSTSKIHLLVILTEYIYSFNLIIYDVTWIFRKIKCIKFEYNKEIISIYS
jgi:hypothetical protein